MNLFWRRCFVCGDYKDTTKYIACRYPYDEVYWYHKGCVHDVLCNPVDYKSHDIKVAIKITDSINRIITERDALIDGALIRCNSLGE